MISPDRIRYAAGPSSQRVRRRFLLPSARVAARPLAARVALAARPRAGRAETITAAPTVDVAVLSPTPPAEAAAGNLGSSAVSPAAFETGSVTIRPITSETSDAGPTSSPRHARETGLGPARRPSESHDPMERAGDPGPSLARRLAAVLQPPLNFCLSSTGPLEWPGDLLDFQRAGIAVLVEQPCVLLADDMGLGKTIQAAAAMRLLVRRGQIETALVVAPAGVLRNWRMELAKWAPELRVLEVSGPQAQRAWKWRAAAHVNIVSYDTLRSDFQRLRHLLPEGASWDIVCLDEAQRIKNRESTVSSVVRQLVCDRRWALTGTPLENSLDDVRSILSFLRPTDHSGRPLRLAGDQDVRLALDQLQLRRKKSEVLPQLPPKTVTELFVSLNRNQRAEYDRLFSGGAGDLREKGERVTVTDVLALIMLLKQVCNFSFETGSSSKLDDVSARVRNVRAEGHKALVFSQFTSEVYGVRRLAQALAEFRPIVYTGDMSASQKQEAIQRFESDPDSGLLVLSLRAGGVGLNLQRASYVFHFDRWWNPAVEVQAEDRSHRIGQTRGVTVYKYICENTIEERIHEILLSKKALFDEYVDDVCLDLTQRLSEDELFGLFDVAPPKRKAVVSQPDYRAMTGADFEVFVKDRLEKFGYRVELTPVSRDGGVDLLATKSDELGLETTLLVQCKNWSNAAGPEVVRELNGVIPRDGRPVQGMVACTGGFTSEAVRFAEKCHILLWGPKELGSVSQT